MARTFSQGKYALSISDRSGQAFPYLEMVKEWTGALVHFSEYEPKSPLIDPKVYGGDPQALRNTRVQHNLGNMTVRVGVLQGTIGESLFSVDHGYNDQGKIVFGVFPLPQGKILNIYSAVGKVTVVV